ncbi:MAG: phytoene desaturase [Saprospiraceae bacterium]|nr:phytoene desaturase [Saprospiraceae bacterium]
MKGKVAVIGGGFSGLSAACYAAANGFDVTVFEKHPGLGGRARQWVEKGFTFDMGPSWYWMPDVFERFFGDFDKKVNDFYQLKRLDPGFRIYYPHDFLDIPADHQELFNLFEKIEKGGGEKLLHFMKDAKYKYDVGMTDLVYKPGLKWSEFFDKRLLSAIFNLSIATPFDKYVHRYFKDERLRQLMEFPVLFLGAAPNKTPALYSLMNYAGLMLGTWYPAGGMHKIVEGMARLAIELGVNIRTGSPVEKINVNGDVARSVTVKEEDIAMDYIISSADYKFTEEKLLDLSHRNYSETYWNKRTMAPSSLIFYLGVKGRVKNLQHHNLFFDENLASHTAEIYDQPAWPTDPLFYVCCPSKTDASVAPENCENIFILMPLAAGLEDTHELRNRYFERILDRLESRVEDSIRHRIEVKRSYCVNDYIDDYHAYRGNAYGLANTLRQTANLKPKIRNKKVKNLIYTGHLTVPGPGVPPSIISGKLAAGQLEKGL